MLQNNRATIRRMLARARRWSWSAGMESWYTWYGPTTGASPSRSATTTATRTGALTACRRGRYGCFSAGTVYGTPEFAGNMGLQLYRFGTIVVFGSRGGLSVYDGTTSSVRSYGVCNHVRRSLYDVRDNARRRAVSGRKASVILS